MLNVLLAIVAWWLSLWDLKSEEVWPMPTVLLFFLVACLLYVLARMVSPVIPDTGSVDLREYHSAEGRKYATVFAVECAITVGTVFLYGTASQNWLASNWATAPSLAASIAAAATSNRWVHGASISLILVLWVWYFATLQGALG
jgi:hypothetical protein